MIGLNKIKRNNYDAICSIIIRYFSLGYWFSYALKDYKYWRKQHIEYKKGLRKSWDVEDWGGALMSFIAFHSTVIIFLFIIACIEWW